MRHVFFIFFVLFLTAHGSQLTTAFAYEPKDAEEALRLGDEALYFKEYDKAEAFYEWAAEEKPKEAEPVVRLGQVYYAKGEYQKAREKFEEARRLNRGAGAKKFIETALKKMQEHRDLLGEIERLSADSSVKTAELLELHRKTGRLMGEGDTYMALVGPHDETVAAAEPRNAEVLRTLADGYYSASDPARAIRYYKKLRELYPRHAALNKRLGDASVAVGDYGEARNSYRAALREWVRALKGVSLNAGEERQVLLDSIGEVKRNVQALPLAYEGAEVLIKKGQVDLAFGALKRRLSLNPGDAAAMTLMGQVYEEIGQEAQSERLYKKVVEMRPEYPAGHYYLGRFYLLKKQKYEEAIEELKLFKYWIKEGISRVEEAKTKEAQHKNFISASRYIAYVYLEVLDKPAHAVKELEGLARSAPVDDPEVYYDLGAAYLRDKKRMSAYQAFKKALSLNPKEELKKKAEEAIEVIRAYPDEGWYTKPRGW